jgi:flagellar capping protein FliD
MKACVEFSREGRGSKMISMVPRVGVFLFLAVGWIPENGFSRQLLAQQFLNPPKIDSSSVAPMKQLLVDFWQPGTANREQAEQLFASFQPVSNDLTLAYVANRLNDNRTREAGRILDAATSRDPKFLDGWLLKAYLDILSTDYGPALMSLRSAKNALNGTALDATAKLVFYRRTGELIGYLKGPVARRVDQNLLDATLEHLLTAANDEEIGLFNTAVAQIRDQFENRTETAQGRLEEEMQKQAAVDASLEASLTAQNQNLALTERSLRERVPQLQAELSQQESQLTSQLSPLESTVQTLNSQIRSLQWTLSLLYQDLALVQNGPVHDPFVVRAILDQIQRTEWSLYNLQVSQQSAATQYNSLQTQIQSVRATYQEQINQTQRELRRVSGTLTRNQSQLARIAAGPQVAAGKREAEESRVTSLSHYIKLPAVLLRQELLELIESM